MAVAALAALAVLAAPSSAGAQPGAPPPPGYGGGGYGYYGPPPDAARRGLTLGVGLGLGLMDSDSNLTDCFGCGDDQPLALALDAHLGVMLSPHLALLGEVFWQGQGVDGDTFDWIGQTMLMGAIQFWLTPQLWIKGGLGVASLTLHYEDFDDELDTGVAVMGAAGFELLSSPWFSIDIQGRLASGSYDGIDDHVNVGTVGLGFNWY
ncbi:MAG TPA: hypothetical protein VKB80_07785 [Kofleriaceae bacterium]|nr:hypothetical protein [Kofleriaceae bacterium]